MQPNNQQQWGPVVVQPVVEPPAQPGGAYPQQPYSASQPQSSYSDETLKEAGSHKKLKLAAGVVALIAVFVGGYFTSAGIHGWERSGAQNQAVAFITALNQGNSSRAYTMTSSTLRNQQSEKQFASALGDLQASKPALNNITVAVNGNRATYSAVESGLPETQSGSTIGTFRILLVKSGVNSWKVDSATVQ